MLTLAIVTEAHVRLSQSNGQFAGAGAEELLQIGLSNILALG